MTSLRWGLLSTAAIGRLVVEANRGAFAGDAGLPLSFGSYEEMLASDQVDAVYVLCEKPFATSADDADRCFTAAESARRLCAEALMWRYHPQTTLARELVGRLDPQRFESLVLVFTVLSTVPLLR
jgi:predicted dehydrogenase